MVERQTKRREEVGAEWLIRQAYLAWVESHPEKLAKDL
jgi:hypothetical protein